MAIDPVTLILLIVGGFVGVMGLLIYLIFTVPLLIEENRRKRSNYTVLIDDYSSGTLVQKIDYANKIKLKDTDTYMLKLTKARKFLPLPTEARIEKHENFVLQSNLPKGDWKQVKERGTSLMNEGAEVLMGMHKNRLILPLVTNDGHNFFFKKKVNSEDLAVLSEQIISESRKLLIENILRYLHQRRTKRNKFDVYAVPIAFIIMIVALAFVATENNKTQIQIAELAAKPVIMNIDGLLVEDYLNQLNLTYEGKPIDPLPAPAG